MQVAVLGAGALGCLFGGLLAGDGNEVRLLHHRSEAAAAIDESGVTIEAADGSTRDVDVRATVNAAAVGPVDLALVLVKSYATLDAVEMHAECVGPDTRVLSLQNGVTNHHRLREHVGAGRTLHGVTYQGASLAAPGHVVRSSPGPSRFGGDDADFAGRVAAAFESAGIEAEVVDDPFEAIWRKQLWGAAIKPTAALTRLSNGGLVEHEGTRAVMRRLMAETAAVAEARGIDLDAEATFEVLREGLSGSDHVSSMLQDVRAGRRTEIEDVNGANVQFGREAGVDVPVNEVAAALVRGLESGFLEER